jgi:hypothetical protein
VEATKFHKVYEDPNGFFSDTQLNNQILTTTNGVYALLDNGDGILLTRTDLEGNVVWSHLYGSYEDKASTLTGAQDGNLIVVSWYLDTIDTVAAKIDAETGEVIWAMRYPYMNEAFTVTRRGSRHVLMGETTYRNAAGDYLVKPIAIAIRDSDGSVIWAKEYLEGTNDYLENYHHRVQGAAVNPGTVSYVGQFYDAIIDPHGADRRRVSLLTIDAGNGLVPINAMHSYDLELNGSDYAIETDSPFVWDITRVTDDAGQLDGFAISGTYSHSSTYSFYATDPVVFRVTQTGDPVWAMLYGSPNGTEGFGRGIRQNVYFNGGRLDVYTAWYDYQNGIDGRSTVSGLMRINELDGAAAGIAIYDVPNADFAGLCLGPDGTGGYVALAVESVSPYNSFELLKVGQIGGNVDCYLDHTLEPEVLAIDDDIVEIVPVDVPVAPIEFSLPWVDLSLTVSECDE